MLLNKEEKKIEFEQGDVLCYTDNTFVGKAIRFLTIGAISHCGIVINENESFEAYTSGIQIFNINEALKRSKTVYLCKLKPEYKQLIERNSFKFNECIKKYNNTPYGWLSAGKAFLDTYFKFIPFRNADKLCCSALVAKMFFYCSLPITQKPTEYTPDEIFDLDFYTERILIKDEK